MEYNNDQCEYKPCLKTKEININDILGSISATEYDNDIVLLPGHSYIPSKQITKVKSLEIQQNSKITFDLYNSFEYYVFVVDSLVINNISASQYALEFRWHLNNLPALLSSLHGKRGADGKTPINWGQEGFPGERGEKGKTRHAPHIFFFVKEMVLQNTNLEDVKFNFFLKGFQGGNGGDGGNGGNGQKGKKGRNGSSNGRGGCKRGKNGSQGGKPGFGGRGGDGGCGGNGPFLDIFYTNLDFEEIFTKSDYNLEGAKSLYNPDKPGNWGLPGIAGKPGIGGDGGSRHGNCSGGHRGKPGLPPENSREWHNRNFGHGYPSQDGHDGEYQFDEIDNYLRVVYDDPLNPIDSN